MKKSRWFLILLLLLALPALACGLFESDDAEATAVPVVDEPAEVTDAITEPTTAPPTQVVEEVSPDSAVADAPEEAPVLPSSALALSTIEDLPFDSYQMTMLLQFTGLDATGETVIQSMNADLGFSKEPPATSVVITYSGIEEGLGEGAIEMVQLEDSNYMVVPEMGCVTTTGENLFDANPFISMLSPDEFLNNLEDANYEGEETVNDIQTYHYSYDKQAFANSEINDVDEAEGHVYIAQEGGFLVRMTLEATGQMDLFDAGTEEDGELVVEINLTNVDEPVEINKPAACETGPGGPDAEFLMVDGATDVASFAGVLSYKTDLSVEDVLAFYENAMADEGWTKDENSSIVGGGTALLTYLRDGETVNLTIGPDEESGGTYVVIISENGE